MIIIKYAPYLFCFIILITALQNQQPKTCYLYITVIFLMEALFMPYEPHCAKTGLRGFRPGQTQIGLYSHKRWRIEVDEGLYYQYSEIKGPDQLRSYCAADLRLCFRICKKPVFS